MLSFDPDNPRGPGTKAKLATADLLAALSPFQELCHATTSGAARTHVRHNMPKLPDFDDQYTVDELANMGLVCWIRATDGGRSAAKHSYGKHDSGGRLRIYFRYHVRHDETGDVVTTFNAFDDCMDAIMEQFTAALTTAECPMAQQTTVVMASEPQRSDFDQEAAQSTFFDAAIEFDWGHTIGD